MPQTVSGATVTDEASLIESLGHPVRVVPGRAENMKVTYPSDLGLVEALLASRVPDDSHRHRL